MIKRVLSLLALFVLFNFQTDGQYYDGYPSYGYKFNQHGCSNPYGGYNLHGGFGNASNLFGGANALATDGNGLGSWQSALTGAAIGGLLAAALGKK
ncbi:unnamed protein product [Angiostrongylus costaricensis]|uniref:Rick_17kDa_Anti domain-containing protein n=1 Tax=Angiostrongylus costaricensis TaxID=334426 RepID=A0A0R3Q2R5_ANGCS|nr:unnamed protein product [Angiostrongylus costaricensis]